jgi:hypothetical protein
MVVHATIGAAARGSDQSYPDRALILEHAGGAVGAGVSPDSAEGMAVLDQIVPAGVPAAAERARLAEQVETCTDRRAERYWQLIGAINGRPPVASSVPAFEWLTAALRAAARALAWAR